MTTNDFVHLHVHTEYSLLDGLSRLPKLISHAKNLGMSSLAITDHGAMYGVIDFYRKCIAAEIKPIIGMEGYLARRRMTDRDSKLDTKPYHMLMLAENAAGYSNLLKIASTAQLEGYYYRPRTDKEFLASHSEGIIATSGCLAAEIPNMVMNGREAEARETIDWYLQVFGKDRFFLELQVHERVPELKPVNEFLTRIGKKDDIRLVATNDVHYVLEEDYDPHDTLLCIQTGALKTETNRLSMSDNSYFLADQAQMWNMFGHINEGEALKNSLLIAEMCNVSLDTKGYHLPVFPVPEGFTDAAAYLEYLCFKGLQWRFGENGHDAQYVERVKYELGIINKMGFATYFLIVWDLCEFARETDIWWNVRGSGAGSLVAYSLGITNIDPIQNHLLFERFLNPGRVSMPDIDIDYPDDRRSDMIAYTVQKYGEDKVAAIITFGTMGAKAAVRDVGRALNVDLSKVNAAARLIPTEPKPKPVLTYVEDNPELKKLYQTDGELKQVIDTASVLQGISRHSSVHAAGIIVGDQPLVEYIPLTRQAKEDTSLPIRQVTQFPMETCESIGLLKIDFLGLSTLTLMRRASDLILKHRGVHLTMDNIPYRPSDDEQLNEMLKEAFVMMGRGETIGVFQVESPGMQKMLREMRPTRFENIIAGVALYRPGPMDFIPRYNARMHGTEEIKYHHPELEPILSETFGIIVYQEQIMQIASRLFGYTLGDADLMRKAVSKKKKEDLQKHKEIFLEKGPENDVDVKTAEVIFDEIEFFANYGFNRSHAADYAVVTVQTAFLKRHYPEEFMAALLTVYFDDTAKVTTFLGECKRLSIPILPPDVNYSELDFDIQLQQDQTRGIRFGLAAIKGAGVGALQMVLEERHANGIFKDLDDLCRRVDLRKVGKKTVESLIKVGAFDSLKAGTRAQLVNALERLMNHSSAHHKNKDAGQIDMFGGQKDVTDDMLRNLPQMDEVNSRTILEWEKELMGLYISSHPIDPILDQLAHVHLPNSYDLKESETFENGQGVRFVGLVAALRKIPTKNKDMMAVATLEDRYGTIEAVMFPKTWAQHQDKVTDGVVAVFMGKLDTTRGEAQIIVESVTQQIQSVISASNDLPDINEFRSKLSWMNDEDLEDDTVDSSPPARYTNGHTPAEHTPVPPLDSTVSEPMRVEDNGGYGTSQEPPTFDELPIEIPTEFEHDAHNTKPKFVFQFDDEFNPPAEPPKLLTIYFHRSGNDSVDKRKLKRLDGILIQNPGNDRFEIVIVEDGIEIQLWEFDDRTFKCHERVCAEIGKIVGDANLLIRILQK